MSKPEKTPTFYCDVCDKKHKASKIGGEWYSVNGWCSAKQPGTEPGGALTRKGGRDDGTA